MNIIFLLKAPNGILLRAFEERPVKLAVSKKNQQATKKDERSDLGKMMSVIIGILVVLIIILFFMYLA
jgi:tetrahydromethanopterin S-methyltransferase subunit G